MAPSDGVPGRSNCCEPGDITVSNVYSGFLIGRAIEPRGPGPWWEYIALVKTEVDAMHQAAILARMAGTRAWRHIQNDDYEPIPVERTTTVER